jgi:hypothetical protein
MIILKRWFAPIILAIAMLAGGTQPASAFLDKTRFVVHLGVAYFCFHHWVMAPYQAGAFAPGAPHRTSTIVKGGIALLFAVHEVHVAQEIAAKSNDPLLKKLNGEVVALSGSFLAIGQRLRAGHFNPSDIGELEGQAKSLGSDASANGVNIKDVPIAVPGT